MKKILSVAAAIALAASIISCGDSSDEFSGAVDTVITISAPSVTGKAYPGVNYITWEPVVGAKSYELYRSDDGDSNKFLTSVEAGATNSVLGYADIAAASPNTALTIADGKTYKYTVLAIGANATAANVNVPSRDVYLKGNKSSVSVKAIVPAAGTSVGDIAYYKSFFQKFDEKNLAKNVVITKVQDVKANGTNWGGYYVTYPATAGLKFAVVDVEETGVGANGAFIGLDSISGTTDGNYKENFVANSALVSLGAGDKDIYVKIESVSGLYPSIVKKVGDIKVESIGEKSATGTVSTQWLAADKAEISWVPATLTATGKETPTSNYVVYRKTSVDGNDDYTKLSATVVAKKSVANATGTTTAAPLPSSFTGTTASATNSKDVSVVYSIEDTITDNTATYTYYVVHTDGTRYGAYKTGTLSAWTNKTDKPTLTFTEVIKSNAKSGEKVIMLVAQKGKKNGVFNDAQKLALTYTKLAKNALGETVKTIGDFTEKVELINEAGDNRTYVAYVTGEYDTDYLFKLTATEDGKTEQSAYVSASVSKLTAATTNLSFTLEAQKDPVDAKDTKYAVVGHQSNYDAATDPIDQYEFTLYSVTTKTADKNYGKFVTVTTKKEGTFDFAKLTAANQTKWVPTGVIADADLYGFVEVAKPEAETDPTKYDDYESARFYIIKQYKGNAASAVQIDLAGWNNIAVK